MTAATKDAFLSFYREELLASYPWARLAESTGKLDLFLRSVRETLDGRADCWMPHGPVCTKAWRRLGLKGKPSLKGLRLLA